MSLAAPRSSGPTRSPVWPELTDVDTEEGKVEACLLTQLYQTDTDWLGLEFSFHDLQDTSSSGLSQETASLYRRQVCGENASRHGASECTWASASGNVPLGY